LFTIDGDEVTRYPTTTPPVLFHDLRKICVGGLTIDMGTREYSVEVGSSCSGGEFPALSGDLADWEIWAV
jgi:hypothetical protein